MSDKSENPRFLESAAFSANLSIPEIEELNEAYPLIMHVDTPIPVDHQFCTKKVFLFNCLRLATSNSVPKSSKAEDLEKIKNLEATITKLLDDATLFNETITRKNNEIESLNNKIIELADKEPEKVTVEKEIIKEKQLSDNQILLTFTPVENDIVKLISNAETKRNAKPITSEMIFKDMFFRFIFKGPGDFFRRPAKDELNKIYKIHTPTNNA